MTAEQHFPSPRNFQEDAYNFLIREPVMAAIEAQRMWMDILANGTGEIQDPTPVLLVPGAGAQPFELLLTQLWYQRVAGFPHTKIAPTSNTGPVTKQLKELESYLATFPTPPHTVSVSAGATLSYALALKKPQLFKSLIILDAPIQPMHEDHFNMVMRRFSVNDMLHSQELMEHLQAELPEELPPTYCFPTRNHRLFDRHLTQHPDIPVYELPVDGHHNLYYNIDAHRIVANALYSLQEKSNG